MHLPIRIAALATVVAFVPSGAVPVSAAEVEAARAVAVGAFFAVQEAFVPPPGEHAVVVSQASPELIATMRAQLWTVLARYYADPQYSRMVTLLDEQFDCGHCAPFVAGFGVDSVEWEPLAFDRSNAVLGGRMYGWASDGIDGHTLPVGSWFRYAMTRTPAGWRVVDAMEGFLPGYAP
jgi:hypothetical protein